MTIIKRKADLKVAKRIDLYDLANVRINEGRQSIIDKNYKISPSIKANGSDCKAFTFEEEKVYMPELLGISGTDPNFGKFCTHYWQSIYKIFDEHGLTFDISFEVPDDKVKDFNNAPENKKYLYGRPVNLVDYMYYRYCWEWSKVANTYKLYKANEHAKNIKYYFHSEAEVKAEMSAALKLETNAMQSYLKAIENEGIVTGILRYFEKNKTGNTDKEQVKEIYVFEDLDEDAKHRTLLNLSKQAPSKFIELVDDDRLPVRTFIYECMSLKVLTQLPGSSMVMFGEDMIGRNMDEAILSISNRPELKNDIILHAKSKKAAAN